MRKYWKIVGIVLIIFLFIGVLFLLFIRNNTTNKISFVSEMPGYDLDWSNQNMFQEFLDETNFFAGEHLLKDRNTSAKIQNLQIVLSSKELPLYQTYFSDSGELMYASDYDADNGELTVYVYVSPKLLGEDSPEVDNRVAKAVNSKILRTLLMNLQSIAFVTGSGAQREGGTIVDEYLDKYVFSKQLNELPFQINK